MPFLSYHTCSFDYIPYRRYATSIPYLLNKVFKRSIYFRQKQCLCTKEEGN